LGFSYGNDHPGNSENPRRYTSGTESNGIICFLLGRALEERSTACLVVSVGVGIGAFVLYTEGSDHRTSGSREMNVLK
jgi:hypothetical protein